MDRLAPGGAGRNFLGRGRTSGPGLTKTGSCVCTDTVTGRNFLGVGSGSKPGLRTSEVCGVANFAVTGGLLDAGTGRNFFAIGRTSGDDGNWRLCLRTPGKTAGSTSIACGACDIRRTGGRSSEFTTNRNFAIWRAGGSVSDPDLSTWLPGVASKIA